MTHLHDMKSFAYVGGYVVHYHFGIVNHCPGCDGTSWHIGRISAQCARCETALPLAQSADGTCHPLFVSRARRTPRHA